MDSAGVVTAPKLFTAPEYNAGVVTATEYSAGVVTAPELFTAPKYSPGVVDQRWSRYSAGVVGRTAPELCSSSGTAPELFTAPEYSAGVVISAEYSAGVVISARGHWACGKGPDPTDRKLTELNCSCN